MSDLPNLLKILRATASTIADELEKLREEALTTLRDDPAEEIDISDLESAVENSISHIDDVSIIIESIAEELEISFDD